MSNLSLDAPTARAAPLARSPVAGLTAAVSLAGFAACAPMTAYNPDHLPPEQIGRIGEICQTVMGLPKGADTHYYACLEGLSQPVATQPQPSVESAYGHAGPASQPSKPAGYYFYASNDEIHRRVQKACAQVGYDQAGAGFATCVGDLHLSLFEADNPLR